MPVISSLGRHGGGGSLRVLEAPVPSCPMSPCSREGGQGKPRAWAMGSRTKERTSVFCDVFSGGGRRKLTSRGEGTVELP